MNVLNEEGYLITSDLLIHGYSKNDVNNIVDIIKLILDFYEEKLFVSEPKIQKLLADFYELSKCDIEFECYLLLLNVKHSQTMNASSFNQLFICIFAEQCGFNACNISKGRSLLWLSRASKKQTYFEMITHNAFFREINLNINEMNHALGDIINSDTMSCDLGIHDCIKHVTAYCYKTLKDIKTMYHKNDVCDGSTSFGVFYNDKDRKAERAINYMCHLKTCIADLIANNKCEIESIYCMDWEHYECDEEYIECMAYVNQSAYQRKYNYLIIQMKNKSVDQFQFFVWNLEYWFIDERWIYD